MTPAISQGILAAQALLAVVALLMAFRRSGRSVATGASIVSTALMVLHLAIFAAMLAGLVASDTLDTGTAAVYAGASVIAALLTWGMVRLAAMGAVAMHARNLDKPATRGRAGDELREILRSEGIELDARLEQAKGEREQFLHYLETQHADQIAGLAREYHHEAQTILTQLLGQLTADSLQPMVEERLAEHRQQVERELGALDAAGSGEALKSLREELRELMASVETAEARVTKLRADNPDTAMEDLVEARLATIDGRIDERVVEMTARFDAALAGTTTTLDARIAEVGELLDAKVDVAGSPLVARMAEAEAAVAERLAAYDGVLTQRFTETEEILNQRILEQEGALEARVTDIEAVLEDRLAHHAVAIDGVLAQHDEAIHGSLAEQIAAIDAHTNDHRERIATDLTAHATDLQSQVAAELAAAEERARETVEATQVAWNHFTEELEERFAATREEALAAAAEIARAEREQLESDLAAIANDASGEIAQRVEMLGKEAAWQRAQVERTVHEAGELLSTISGDALANADTIFADLERMGEERVERIRRQAEDALVQSRDYVAQLQESLGVHLDGLRERSSDLADEMNERLTVITTTGQNAAEQLENYARELVDATSRELGNAAEHQITLITDRVSGELAGNLQRNLDDQRRGFEQQVTELASRITQQVNGDLSGVADHARQSITADLEGFVHEAREQARQAQEEGYRQLTGDLARQQGDLADQARVAADQTRTMLENSLRESRRQLEEAMASMGAHMREELVRFNDEGQRRIGQLIDGLRDREHSMLQDEDRKLTQARAELMRQHQSQLEGQFRSMIGGLSGAIGSSATDASPAGMTLSAQAPAHPGGSGNGGQQAPTAVPAQQGGAFSAGVQRPATPLGLGGSAGGQTLGQASGASAPFSTGPAF